MRKMAFGWKQTAAGAAAAALAMGGAFMGVAAASPAEPQQGEGVPQHIFYIMMENHGKSQIIGNTTDAPYINQLATKYNTASNFHGVTHPSLPNYLSAFSGSFQGIWDDCKAGAAVTCSPEEFVPGSGDATDSASLTPAQVASASKTPHMFSGRNLVDQLEAKGRTWKAYMQSMPQAGFEGEYAPGDVNGTAVKLYAQKHNPFMYFSDINSPGNPRLKQVVPLEKNFDADLASGTVPNFSWISPDQCHDMHGISPSAAAIVGLPDCGTPSSGLDHGPIRLGDQFLRDTVTKIMNSPTWKSSNSSIVINWDENDYSGYSGGPGSPVGAKGAVLGGGDAPLIVINSHGGPHKDSNVPADHYTVLATLEHMWHLGCLENTCSPRTSGSLRDLFAR
ncbi:alkaline phosphatase family protein [Streptomyces sp. NPDC059101]|uniref:alkaline phosphatase family protein n=1 Tax=Streptomyces sp. NPDC059101 TaxID=3346728 RepID=UPI003683962A